MLQELVVRNLGVIGELSLVLGDGMTAVTGETGAGKTLVVGAIDLLTGGRADAGLVRPGAEEAEIEGRFVDGDREVVVRRVIPREGRSRAYVDGRLATVAALSELGAEMVDLHGQHAHQSFLSAAVQRDLLDRFGEIDTTTLADIDDDLRAVRVARDELGGDERSRAREIDLLRHQLDEIAAAGLDDPEEDAALDRDESTLADAVGHREAAQTSVAALDADSATAAGIGSAIAALDGRTPFADAVGRLQAVAAELTDVVAELRDGHDAIDEDPARLEELRQRRALLRELRRKYGDTLADVLAFADESTERLHELEAHDERAAALDVRHDELVARREVERAVVRAARLAAAGPLAEAVESNLAALAMADARVEVVVDGPAGGEVTIMLAANAGHEPQPLAKVASGGELARTALALRLVLTAGPATLVFDEVDAGIGGDVARTVGENLAALADDHQVLVVTHLAQVAAFADHHIAVHKHTEEGTTHSAAILLDDRERVVELSRLLSGSPDSTSAQEHAVELRAAAARS